MKILLSSFIFSGFCFAAQKTVDEKSASSALQPFSDKDWLLYDHSRHPSERLDADMKRYLCISEMARSRAEKKEIKKEKK
jgi:hypothetical protein